MAIPKKYITVVPLIHPGTPDGTLKQINPKYVEYLEEKLEAAKNCLVCLPIADPVEIVENTYKILEDPEE